MTSATASDTPAAPRAANADACVIAVLSFNTSDLTLRLVDSLRASGAAAPIWVIDNGSSDVEAQKLVAARNAFRLIRLPENGGFVGGVNHAVKTAASEGFRLVYMLNNDVLVTPGFLEPCLDKMRRYPHLAMLGSRTFMHGSGAAYDQPDFMCSDADAAVYTDNLFFTVNKVPACGMILRVDPILAVGGMDERFFIYFEETDLLIRLHKRGFASAICYDSVIYHDHQGSNRNENAAFFSSRNTFLICAKHWAHGYLPLPMQFGHYRFPVLLAQCLGALADLLTLRIRRFRARVEGTADGRRGYWGRRPPLRSFPRVMGLFLANLGALLTSRRRRYTAPSAGG